MWLYSIIPAEEVFRGMDITSPEVSVKAVDVVVGGVEMQVEPTGLGQGTIVRLLSTDPAHYLRPDLQPGSSVQWTAELAQQSPSAGGLGRTC